MDNKKLLKEQNEGIRDLTKLVKGQQERAEAQRMRAQADLAGQSPGAKGGGQGSGRQVASVSEGARVAAEGKNQSEQRMYVKDAPVSGKQIKLLSSHGKAATGGVLRYQASGKKEQGAEGSGTPRKASINVQLSAGENRGAAGSSRTITAVGQVRQVGDASDDAEVHPLPEVDEGSILYEAARSQEFQSQAGRGTQQILKFDEQNRSTQYLDDGRSGSQVNRIGSSHPGAEAVGTGDREQVTMNGLGAQDSIIMDSAKNRSGPNVHDKHLAAQDSLNHMIIRSNMQAQTSSVQMTMAESSQLRSNSKQGTNTRREHNLFNVDQSMITDLQASPQGVDQQQRTETNQTEKMAKIKNEVMMNRLHQQEMGNRILSNHLAAEEEINIVSKQLSIFSDQQSKENFFKQMQEAQTRHMNTRNTTNIAHQTTSDLQYQAGTRPKKAHDPNLTLRTVDDRNGSTISLQLGKKLQGSPARGGPRPGRAADKVHQSSMAPGFSSLPRIDLNKNVNSLSEIFPYEDTAGKDLRSTTQMKYNRGGNMPQHGNHYNKLPRKDRAKQTPKVAATQPQVVDNRHFQISQQFFGQRNKKLKTQDLFTASPESRDPASGPRTAGLWFPKKQPNLKEALLGTTKNENIDNVNNRPEFVHSREDLLNLRKGKAVSKKFLSDNKEEIQRFIDQVMSSEEKMMGYLEYSNKTMMLQDRCPDHEIHIEHARAEQQDLGNVNEQDESALVHEAGMVKSEEDNIEHQQRIKQKHARYLFDPSTANETNKAYMSVMQRRPKKKIKGQNATLDSIGVTSKVMETWINETLTDAEHLDIPGCILQPEHKNPITRYGIDRIEMDNCGVPRDFVDRIYRCLFVYSVGFYEMIKKLISHSNQKYSLVTRIWKVFAVLLEYCCVTDYKMMITQISKQHDEEVARLKQDFDVKLDEFVENEKILKQNIAALQKSNEDMERERTNERSLRLRLEEEYMQNTKNHEEEVQLRLKFESKLNMMHTQQRETDIRYNRAMEENQEMKSYVAVLEQQLKELKESNYSRGLELTEKTEKLSLLEEEKAIWTADIKNKAEQLERLDSVMKLNNKEVNQSRYEMAEMQNEKSKLVMQVDLLNTRATNLQTRNEALEAMFTKARQEKQAIEEQSLQLKDTVNTQIVSLSEQKQKDALNTDDLRNKTKLLETQKAKIQEQNQFLEDLSLIKQSQSAEIEALKDQLKAIRRDFDESAEKLHKTNRYRHELELRYQAEKLTQERLQKSLLEREAVVEEQNKKIMAMTDKLVQRERNITELRTEVKDLRDDISLKINEYGHQINSLTLTVTKERAQAQEWAEKYSKTEGLLKEKSETTLTLQQQVKLHEVENGRLGVKLEAITQTLAEERKEREEQQRQAHESHVEMQKTQQELKIMLQVSRQLEVQRARQRDQADERHGALEQENELLFARMSMETEDQASKLLRMSSKYNELHGKMAQMVKDHKQQEERTSMHLEDCHRQIFNFEHRNAVQDFAIMDLQAQTRHSSRRRTPNAAREAPGRRPRASKQPSEYDTQDAGAGVGHLSEVQESRESATANDQSQEDEAAQEVEVVDEAEKVDGVKGKRKRRFKDVAVQVGDEDLLPFSQSKLGSLGQADGRYNSTSPNKNEKLVSELRKTAKNALLKAKAYRRRRTKDSREDDGNSHSGHPASLDARLQDQMSERNSYNSKVSKASKASAVSAERRQQNFEELRNQEAFLRIETGGGWDQRDEGASAPGSQAKSQQPNLPSSGGTNVHQPGLAQMKRLAKELPDAKRDKPQSLHGGAPGKAKQQYTTKTWSRRDVEANNKAASGLGTSKNEGLNMANKFSQSAQVSHKKWAEHSNSKDGSVRPPKLAQSGSHGTSNGQRSLNQAATITKSEALRNKADQLAAERQQRSSTQQEDLAGGPAGSLRQSRPTDAQQVTQRNPDGSHPTMVNPQALSGQSPGARPALGMQEAGSWNEPREGDQGRGGAGVEATFRGQPAVNPGSEDLRSTRAGQPHPTADAAPEHNRNPSPEAAAAGLNQRQQVKLFQSPARGDRHQPMSGQGSSEFSTLQAQPPAHQEGGGAADTQALPARGRQYAGNSVQHHQQLGQQMDEIVGQLGIGLADQRGPQHVVDAPALDHDSDAPIIKKKQGQSRSSTRQIKALLRGAQSRDGAGANR